MYLCCRFVVMSSVFVLLFCCNGLGYVAQCKAVVGSPSPRGWFTHFSKSI